LNNQCVTFALILGENIYRNLLILILTYNILFYIVYSSTTKYYHN